MVSLGGGFENRYSEILIEMFLNSAVLGQGVFGLYLGSLIRFFFVRPPPPQKVSTCDVGGSPSALGELGPTHPGPSTRQAACTALPPACVPHVRRSWQAIVGRGGFTS